MINRKGFEIGKGKPLVCVPVVEENETEIIAQIRSLAEQRYSMIEWRADHFADLADIDHVRAVLDAVAPFMAKTLLLFTIRTVKQGGRADLPEKLLFNLQAMAAGHPAVDLVDMEYLEAVRPEKQIRRLKKQDCIVIASHHDFEKTPDTILLQKLTDCMYTDGADIAKIAVMPQSMDDVLAMLQLTSDIKEKHPDELLITISMGSMGSFSRMCGEVFGSCVTFGSVGSESAPGQFSADKLETMLAIIHESCEK